MMGLESFNQSLGMLLQVVLLDLLLSGDNALVIALVCNTLPEELRTRAVCLATGLAIGLRLILTLLVSLLLYIPLLKIIGAGVLVMIAIRLLLGDDADSPPAQSGANRLGAAVLTVVSADVAMSLDNVMGLAGATEGAMLPLLMGLLLSIPLLMYGSLFLARALQRNPWLVPLGSMVLAWIGGRLACGDPLVAGWIDQQAPALQLVLPLCCVVFVLLESRIIRRRRGALGPQAVSSPSLLEGCLERFGEALLKTSLPSQPPLATATITPAAPQEQPAPIATTTDSRGASPSGTESSLGMKVLMWIAIAICLTAIAWLAAHLLNHGLLPAPRPPA